MKIMAVDKNKGTDFFTRLHEGLQEEEPDMAAMQQSLEEQGIDVEATVSKGLRLFADDRKRKRLFRAQTKLKRLQEAVRTWTGSTEQSLGTIKEEIARVLGLRLR